MVKENTAEESSQKTHLCIGSYVRILTSCAIPAERKFDPFCEKIMLSLLEEGITDFSYESADGNLVFYSPSNFNKIHSSSQNLPGEVMQMALRKNPHDIERYFINVIIPALDEARKKNAVLALKDVILKDTKYIFDTTQLGTLRPLTRKELKSKTEFVLSEFLTDIFIFAVAKTENTIEPAFTKSIKKDFLAQYNQAAATITLIDASKQTGISVPPEKRVEGNLGFQQLTENDRMLLMLFKTDFDDMIKKCIQSDQPDICLLSRGFDGFGNLFRKWKDRISNFEDIGIQSDVLHTIATLRDYCNALDPDSEPIPGSPVRILRMKLRNCYVKLHPDEYTGAYPYAAFIDDWNDGEDYS